MGLSLALILGIRPVWGIDFVGGSLLEVQGAPDTTQTTLHDFIQQRLELVATIQTGEQGRFVIRTEPLDEPTHQRVLHELTDAGLITQELRFSSVGPTVGAALVRRAWIAIGLAVVTMVAYLAYIFRQSSGLVASWKFGVAAVYALVHDLLVVLALFVVLGAVFGVSLDTLFVTAMLAILGYSVNDTIVIFNRFQSLWMSSRTTSLRTTLDSATTASVVRSLNTSLTTLLVLLLLLLLGGSTIRWFVVALTAGTAVGTYSSLFVAPPFLYFLARRK